MLLRGLIEPIPQLIDESRYEVRIASRLGVPVTELADMPPHYVAAVRVDMAIDRIHAEQRKDEVEKIRRRTATRRR